MKTAVSIPDPIFHAADDMAKRLGISRSRLYSQAIQRFLKLHRTKSIKETLDAIYATEESKLDPVLAAMQRGSLPRQDW